MVFGLFSRNNANAQIIEDLHTAIVEAARQPAFYRFLGVPDTVEGRFDLVTLHAVLAVRRLKTLPDPAGELAQDVTDRLFAGFEAALRELGVGDLAVPKRMKTLASAFLGRAVAYEEALQASDDALATALARNVQARTDSVPPEAHHLAAYVRASVVALDGVALDAFTTGKLPFPDAARYVPEESRS